MSLLDANPNFQNLGFKVVHVSKGQGSNLCSELNSVDWGDFEVLLNHESNLATPEILKRGLVTYMNPECKFGFVFTILDSEN